METLKFVTLVTVLVVQVQHSIQLRSTHPLHHLVETVNNYGGPYIGLLMAYPTEEAALVTSRFFVPSSNVPSIDLAGKLNLDDFHQILVCFFFLIKLLDNVTIRLRFYGDEVTLIKQFTEMENLKVDFN